MDLNALEIEQNGRTLYVTSLTAGQLKDEDYVRTDEWSPRHPEGYQRKPTDTRVAAFARFVGKARGVSPLSVTLSVRDPVKFIRKEDQFGVLKIPKDVPLWIVDGQHRIKGLRSLVEENPEFENYTVPAVIMPVYDLSEEN